MFDRITFDPRILGGRASIRGMRIPVSVIVGRREGDIPNCSGKLHDPGKRAFRRLGILPQQLRTSLLSAHAEHAGWASGKSGTIAELD